MRNYYTLLKPLLILILSVGLAHSEQDTSTNVSAEQVAEYQEKAEQGNVAAQVLLGDCYDKGKGVKQDYGKAAEWFMKAAEQGNPAAQYMLGNYFLSGKGVEENKREAINLYREAAEHGFSEAEFMLMRAQKVEPSHNCFQKIAIQLS